MLHAGWGKKEGAKKVLKITDILLNGCYMRVLSLKHILTVLYIYVCEFTSTKQWDWQKLYPA